MLVHQLLQNGYDNDTAVIDRGRCISYATLRHLARNYANYLYEKAYAAGTGLPFFHGKQFTILLPTWPFPVSGLLPFPSMYS